MDCWDLTPALETGNAEKNQQRPEKTTHSLYRNGKAKYEASPENTMGFMFMFTHSGTRYWLM